MVKAASHHGLNRKYKKWRRGKSSQFKTQPKKNKGSLKQQLRGQERLLLRLQKAANEETATGTSGIYKNGGKNDDPEPKSTQERIASLQASIAELRQEIAKKQREELQRQNGKKSHGARFLERQRLTRMLANLKKQQDHDEKELLQIALDMVYVAHYPLQERYRPLFHKGNRRSCDSQRELARRAAIRHQALSSLNSEDDSNEPEQGTIRVSWIPKELYALCPAVWSKELEEETFGALTPSSTEVKKPKYEQEYTEDSRFATALSVSHASFLEEAEKIDSQLQREEEQQVHEKAKVKDDDDDDDDDNCSGSDDSENSADKEQSNRKQHKQPPSKEKPNCSSSSSSSSSDESQNGEGKNQKIKQIIEHKKKMSAASSTSSSSSSSSDSEDDKDDNDFDPLKNNTKQAQQPKQEGSSEMIVKTKKDGNNNLGASTKDTDDDDNSTSSSSSSSSSSSGSESSSDHHDDKNKERSMKSAGEQQQQQQQDSYDDHPVDFDDFLVEAQDQDDDNNKDGNVFDAAAAEERRNRRRRGYQQYEYSDTPDKSQGWATQRQFRGKFKKRKTRGGNNNRQSKRW